MCIVNNKIGNDFRKSSKDLIESYKEQIKEIEKLAKRVEENSYNPTHKKGHGVCPGCGRCKHCGEYSPQPIPYYPYPYPTYPTYPYFTWTSTSTSGMDITTSTGSDCPPSNIATDHVWSSSVTFK